MCSYLADVAELNMAKGDFSPILGICTDIKHCAFALCVPEALVSIDSEGNCAEVERASESDSEEVIKYL